MLLLGNALTGIRTVTCIVVVKWAVITFSLKETWGPVDRVDFPWYSRALRLHNTAFGEAETTGFIFVIVLRTCYEENKRWLWSWASSLGIVFIRVAEILGKLSRKTSRFFFFLKAVVNVVPVTSVAPPHFASFRYFVWSLHARVCFLFLQHYSRALCCFEPRAPFHPPPSTCQHIRSPFDICGLC